MPSALTFKNNEFLPYSLFVRCIMVLQRTAIISMYIVILLQFILYINIEYINEEGLLRVSEQRNILHEIRKRKANWIGHILRRNCLLNQVSEGKMKGEMEVIRRRGIRRKKLLDDLKDTKGYSHLKEESLDRTMWRNRFGGGFEPVVRQNTE